MAKTSIKGNALHEGMKGFKTLDSAVANNAGCSCGWVCDSCYSYFVLFDRDSANGDVIGQKAIYIEDGALVVDTVPNVRARQELLASYINATSVVISGCPGGNLTHPDTAQLTVAVLPAGSNQAGTWSSDTPATATVDQTGLVTTVAAGTTTITFTSTDGSFTDTCAITVV